MRIIRSTKSYLHNQQQSVVTIGNFDGLHLGHQQMIGLTKRKASELNARLVVVTFDPLPAEYFSPNNAPERLMSATDKCLGLAQLGVELVCLKGFDKAFSKTTAEEFATKLLRQQLNAVHLVVGDDFRYGQDREGSVETLIEAGLKLGFGVTQLQTVLSAQKRISSTRLRAHLLEGAFDSAKALLGKPYSISSRVTKGDQRGRTWGFPTLNLLMKHKRAVQGVYAVKVRGLSQSPVLGVANIGVRPTIGGRKHLLEVHLFDFDQQVYGKRVCVDFYTLIRNEQKFDSFEALQAQIAADCESAKCHFRESETNK